jgi:flagellar biosynthesis chaperone FliJ
MQPYYNRPKLSMIAKQNENLYQKMLQLQNAIKRVSDNWNDAVSQGIQSSHIQSIISLCNSFNSTVAGASSSVEADLQQLKDLEESAKRKHNE